MQIVNDVTTVADLNVGDTALIISVTNGRPPAAQACYIEAVYQDSPGWIVEYSYNAGTPTWSTRVYGTTYYHSGDAIIDVIRTETN